jgi:hypothetical protein
VLLPVQPLVCYRTVSCHPTAAALGALAPYQLKFRGLIEGAAAGLVAARPARQGSTQQAADIQQCLRQLPALLTAQDLLPYAPVASAALLLMLQY